jgi:ATP-binding cassette, subfamily C, bacterial CydCD
VSRSKRSGPLGALRLSRAARRALAGCAVLAGLHTLSLVAQAFALAWVLADLVADGPDRISQPLALLTGAVLARALLGWATQVVAARAAAGAKEELRGVLLDRSLALGPEWIVGRGAAELTSVATTGLDALDAYFTTYLPALVNTAVLPLAAGAAILVADWPSAIVVLLTLPLVPLFAILVGLRTKDRVAELADTTERLGGHLLELVRALPVLTAFRRAGAQADAVRRVSMAHRAASMATLRVAFASALVLELVATLSVALVAVLIGVRLVHGDLGLAVGLFVLILAPECYLPLRAAGAAHHASEDGVEAARRVAEIPVAPASSTGGRGAVPVGPVTVHDLRVRRRDGYAPDGLSFTVAPGEIHRLDSPSGSGKSTAFAVLLGFTSAESGTVRVAGTDLADLDLTEWRRALAWVPQRPAFTGGTVTEELHLALADRTNFTFPNCKVKPPPSPGAPRQPVYRQRPTVDLGCGGAVDGVGGCGQPGVECAVRAGDGRGCVVAAERELVEVLDEVGAAHLLDRRISALSTGERARVAVARALLRVRYGAWVLLLDEPTAHLDEATAGVVLAAVRRAAASGVAVVLASHRSVEAGGVSAPASGRADDEPESLGGRVSLRRLLSRRLVGGSLLGAGALVSGVALTATSAWLIATASQQPPILTLSVAVVGVRTFGIARAVLRYAERLVTHDAAFRTAADLRVRLWRALVRLGPARTARQRTAEGARRLVSDVDTVRDLAARVLPAPIVAGLVGVATVLVVLAVLPSAALVVVIAIAAAGLGAPAVAIALDRRATAALSAGRRRLIDGVFGLLDAAAELTAFGAHRRRRAELAALDADLAATARREAFGAGAATFLIILATGAAAIVSTWLAADAVAAGTLNPVLAPVLALTPLALAEPLALLPPAARNLRPLRTALARVECGEGPLANVERCEGPLHRIDHAAGVHLRGVDAGWPDAPAVLRNVTLDLAPGEWVAVVGRSGAGKSTLLALLLGFLDARHGTVTTPERVAWCPQEPQLVSTTLRENLRVADPDADDDALANALRQAGIGHWADKLDTVLAGGGGTASGGEATRIALARCLLAARHAGLVLLDEPTAHLDTPTAAAVLRELRTTLAGRTVVHVTHHPDEAAGADRIVEVDAAGRVATRVPALA